MMAVGQQGGFVDEDGNRCRNHARPNSQYCGVHADAEAEA